MTSHSRIASLYALALSTTAITQAPLLDIVPPSSANPASNLLAGASVQGAAYFPATDDFGRELWRSDGTAAGTYRLKDINPGAAPSDPRDFTVVGNEVFFTADVAGYRRELWITDGTPAGTRLVRDMHPSHNAGSNPSELFAFGGRLYFSGSVPSIQWPQLYVSDGTANGTTRVAPLYGPRDFVDAGSVFYFFAGTAPSGPRDLYVSDGTTNGTTLVRQLGSPHGAVLAGNTLFFANNQNTSGTELWKSNGTFAGTTLVKDIQPGALSSTPDHLVEFGGGIVFEADDGVHGRELWQSDGTTAGTILLADIRPGASGSGIDGMSSAANGVVFEANDGSNGSSLWITDGTGAGTAIALANSNPGFFTKWAGGVVFDAAQFGTGLELGFTNGTVAGTYVLDFRSGSASSSPREFTALGSSVLFRGSPSSAILGELCVSDGTLAGTTFVKDLWVETGDSTPTDYIRIGDELLFNALSSSSGIGREPWLSDGSGASTAILVDLYPGNRSSDFEHATEWNGEIWFRANSGSGRELHKSDGSAAGTVMAFDLRTGASSSNPRKLTPAGNRLFFEANNASGPEVYATDGTLAGTVLLDIWPGPSGSAPGELVAVDDRAFFDAIDGTNAFGRELYVSDGTVAGTTVIDINPGAASSNPKHLTAFQGKLYFSATDPVLGTEFWVSDGTAAGTQMVKNLNTNTSGNLANLTVVDQQMFFYAYHDAFGIELWASDGTTAGTRVVKDITPGPWPNNTRFADFAAVGKRLFFFAQDSQSGRELWVSDGTEVGTTLVADLMPGSGDGVVEGSLTALPGTDHVVFAGSDGFTDGLQLWISDGTVAGTSQLGRIGMGTGSGAATLTDLTPVDSELYFACDDGSIGSEPWSYSFAAEQRAIAFSYGKGCAGTNGFAPEISARGMPQIGNTSFEVELANAAANSVATLDVSSVRTDLPFGSCAFLVASQGGTVTVPTDASGYATTPLPIPNDTSLVGASYFGQYYVADLGGPILGLATLSDGLQLLLGN